MSDEDWVYNYFNYFTEIEEHFQRARGTSLFLLSTLDWALIENWKNAGGPLEAVMRGKIQIAWIEQGFFTERVAHHSHPQIIDHDSEG